MEHTREHDELIFCNLVNNLYIVVKLALNFFLYLHVTKLCTESKRTLVSRRGYYYYPFIVNCNQSQKYGRNIND